MRVARRARRRCARSSASPRCWPSSASSTARLPELVGLPHVGRRGDVPRRALQVVGDRPVELVAQRLLDHLRHHRRRAAELRVAEGVLACPARRGRCRRGGGSLRTRPPCSSRAASPAHRRARGTPARRTRISGNRITTGMPWSADQPAGRRDPARMAAHHLEHEHLGRGGAPSSARRTRPRASTPRRTSRPSRSPGSSR